MDAQKVHVVFPEINLPDSDKKLSVAVDKQKINFFYPATLFIFKNHKILFDAFSIIDKLLSKKIILYLTCPKNKDWDFYKYQNVEIIYLEMLPYNEIAGLYQNMDALLFPSYIETLGLPLIEAAHFGLPVIASDLPYARETLEGYEGVAFVNYRDSQAWGNKILKFCTNHPQKKFEPFHKCSASWNELFEILKR
jgi:glycosyltransferase involved in cell wall biosynthesis